MAWQPEYVGKILVMIFQGILAPNGVCYWDGYVVGCTLARNGQKSYGIPSPAVLERITIPALLWERMGGGLATPEYWYM